MSAGKLDKSLGEAIVKAADEVSMVLADWEKTVGTGKGAPSKSGLTRAVVLTFWSKISAGSIFMLSPTMFAEGSLHACGGPILVIARVEGMR